MNIQLRHMLYVFLTLCISLQTILATQLYVKQDRTSESIFVFRDGNTTPILTQNAQPDFRPYIHPIIAPDNNGIITDNKNHQTGLFWGFTNVNGRDYFHNPDGNYWKRVSSLVLKPHSSPKDTEVQWETTYHLLDDINEPILSETQLWTMSDKGDSYILDLKTFKALS